MIHIVLFRPEKPSNTGNIMRTAVALKAVLHIIGPISFSLADKDLKRAGMDYISDLKLYIYSSLDEFYEKNKNADLYYVTRYSSNVYSSFDFKKIDHDYYVMFGRESTGIPHDILRNNYSKTMRIPMVSDARSLNLSNSVAIIAYEIMRQQSFYSLSTQEMLKGDNFLYEEIKK